MNICQLILLIFLQVLFVLETLKKKLHLVMQMRLCLINYVYIFILNKTKNIDFG